MMCDTVRPPLRAARHVLLLVVVGLMTVTHAAMRAHPRSPLPQPSYTLSAHRERMLQASDSATITPSPLAPSSSRTVRPSRTPSNTATTTESVTSSPALQLSSTPSPSFTPSPSPSLPLGVSWVTASIVLDAVNATASEWLACSRCVSVVLTDIALVMSFNQSRLSASMLAGSAIPSRRLSGALVPQPRMAYATNDTARPINASIALKFITSTSYSDPYATDASELMTALESADGFFFLSSMLGLSEAQYWNISSQHVDLDASTISYFVNGGATVSATPQPPAPDNPDSNARVLGLSIGLSLGGLAVALLIAGLLYSKYHKPTVAQVIPHTPQPSPQVDITPRAAAYFPEAH